MNKETQEILLQAIPGAIRAADGVLIPLKDGSLLHALNIHSSEKTKELTDEELFLISFCSKNEIIRLRSLKNAHDYLLRIRAMAIADSPRAVRVMNLRRRRFEQKNHPWSLGHYYHSYDYFHKNYITLLPKELRKNLASIPSGIAPLLEPNAMCIRSFVGDIVVVSESLEKFYYFMTIGFFGSNYGIDFPDRVHALLIAIRIMNGTESLDFDLDSRGVLPVDTERKIKSLVSNQMMFTYGHEFAHYLLGHIAAPETDFNSIPELEASSKESFYTYSHSAEFDADFHAVNNTKSNKINYKKIATGGLLALLFISFLDDIRACTSIKKTATSLTHPKSIDRLLTLHQKLGTNSPIPTRMVNNWIDEKNKYIKFMIESPLKKHKDILKIYGSVYLPSYTDKLRKDRIDF